MSFNDSVSTVCGSIVQETRGSFSAKSLSERHFTRSATENENENKNKLVDIIEPEPKSISHSTSTSILDQVTTTTTFPISPSYLEPLTTFEFNGNDELLLQLWQQLYKNAQAQADTVLEIKAENALSGYVSLLDKVVEFRVYVWQYQTGQALIEYQRRQGDRLLSQIIYRTLKNHFLGQDLPTAPSSLIHCMKS